MVISSHGTALDYFILLHVEFADVVAVVVFATDTRHVHCTVIPAVTHTPWLSRLARLHDVEVGTIRGNNMDCVCVADVDATASSSTHTSRVHKVLVLVNPPDCPCSLYTCDSVFVIVTHIDKVIFWTECKEQGSFKQFVCRHPIFFYWSEDIAR